MKVALVARATGSGASSRKLTAETWSGSSKPQLLGSPAGQGASFGNASARASGSSTGTSTGRAVSVVRRKTDVGESTGAGVVIPALTRNSYLPLQARASSSLAKAAESAKAPAASAAAAPELAAALAARREKND